MQNKQVIYLAVAFQVLILAGMFVKALHPLLTGTPMKLKVETRDPRDIFAGDYVVLNYKFNRLILNDLPHDLDTLKSYNYGDVVYLEMQQKGEFFEPVGIWQEPKEENKTYLKAVVQHRISYNNTLSLKCGIEKYFAPSNMAKKLEDMTAWQNRDSLTVFTEVMVTSGGAARIKKIDYREN